MALNVICYSCKKELEEPGALIFSPPDEKENGRSEVDKYHLCVSCWTLIWNIGIL